MSTRVLWSSMNSQGKLLGTVLEIKIEIHTLKDKIEVYS